jgi:hypothetical protein
MREPTNTIMKFAVTPEGDSVVDCVKASSQYKTATFGNAFGDVGYLKSEVRIHNIIGMKHFSYRLCALTFALSTSKGYKNLATK